MSVLTTILLVGCGSGISDGEFTFDEDEFINKYEDVSGKLAPDDLIVDGEDITADWLDKQEAINILNTLDGFVDSDRVDKVANSVEDKDFTGNDDGVVDDEGKLYMSVREHNDDYMINVFIN